MMTRTFMSQFGFVTGAWDGTSLEFLFLWHSMESGMDGVAGYHD